MRSKWGEFALNAIACAGYPAPCLGSGHFAACVLRHDAPRAKRKSACTACPVA